MNYHTTDIQVAWDFMQWYMTEISKKNLLIALDYLKSEEYENTVKSHSSYQSRDVMIKRELRKREFPEQ